MLIYSVWVQFFCLCFLYSCIVRCLYGGQVSLVGFSLFRGRHQHFAVGFFTAQTIAMPWIRETIGTWGIGLNCKQNTSNSRYKGFSWSWCHIRLKTKWMCFSMMKNIIFNFSSLVIIMERNITNTSWDGSKCCAKKKFILLLKLSFYLTLKCLLGDWYFGKCMIWSD